MRIWLTILACWPAPWSPWRTTVEPRASKHGRTASNTSTGPPTMTDHVPLRAPTSPADTGASSAKSRPAAAVAAGHRRVEREDAARGREPADLARKSRLAGGGRDQDAIRVRPRLHPRG